MGEAVTGNGGKLGEHDAEIRALTDVTRALRSELHELRKERRADLAAVWNKFGEHSSLLTDLRVAVAGMGGQMTGKAAIWQGLLTVLVAALGGAIVLLGQALGIGG